MKGFRYLALNAIVLPLLLRAQVPSSSFINFEGAQTNPIRLSADRTRLFAVNTPDARLSVFDLSDPSNPRLTAEIPVGIEPVSVNPRTNDEVWVVNQVSDSVSIVSVSQGIVTDTLQVKDEPADVVFAGSYAFISVSRSNEIRVFDLNTHAQVKAIPVFGENPRAMAVSNAGDRIYAAFALSGNRTTNLGTLYLQNQPPPTNPNLPPPPQVTLIVDATDPNWFPSAIKYRMPDNDVVEIDVSSLSVRQYYSRVGTINLGIAVRPSSGELYVTNTDANNLTRFEPNLRGKFAQNRITKIDQAGVVTPIELNPGTVTRATAIGQPAAVVFEPAGQFMYVASFGTDRIALVDLNGRVTGRIEIGPASGTTIDPRRKTGPRGLALNAGANRLYVLNRISNSISVVDTEAKRAVRELNTGSFDPTPVVIRAGRGFLYDSKLSGNGTLSCATCHVDADMDLLDWDLGDPGGTMTIVRQEGDTFRLHPMKGPMMTQSLRGLKDLEPFHWRGDRETFADFNPAFDKLMAGTPLSDQDMQAYSDFIMTIRYMPNPYQNRDRTLPRSVNNGDPQAGQFAFLNTPYNVASAVCNDCHTFPGPGSNRMLKNQGINRQPMKVAQLRNVYQKLSFRDTHVDSPNNTTVNGFGLLHNAEIAGLFMLLVQEQFKLFKDKPKVRRDVAAFVTCFDTGMAPAVGYSVTLNASNVNTVSSQSNWNLLESQAVAGNIELIAKGKVDGELRGLLYRPATNDYKSDSANLPPVNHQQLASLMRNGSTLTLMGVPPGTGKRMGIDRDLDGVLDADE